VKKPVSQCYKNGIDHVKEIGFKEVEDISFSSLLYGKKNQSGVASFSALNIF